MTRNEDSILIRRFQSGDRAAFDTLISRHEARAYLFAYRLTGRSEEASDVVAEAFVRVFKALDNFQGNSAFSTWLYRILTNCFLDLRKRESCRPTTSLDAMISTDDGEVVQQVVDPNRTPYEEAERSERERGMAAAVQQLPSYQRVLILMYHVESLRYAEIAEVLDLPLGTVKSRLNRARLSLRSLLIGEGVYAAA